MKGSGVVVQTIRYAYSGGAIGTTSWVQLDAAIDQNVMAVEIFDSSGECLELGQGPAGSEARLCFIMPGGNGHIPLIIPQSMRLSVRAVSANTTTGSGQLCINLYG